MIAVLLAAGICLAPPFQDPNITTNSNICTVANQAIECQCSECMVWDPVEGADWYDINRVDQDGTVHSVIGTSKIIESFTDDDGTFHPKIALNWYCFAFDASTPIDGRKYTYAVRACSISKTPNCGNWTTQTIAYTGAPITCYDGGRKIACPTIP